MRGRSCYEIPSHSVTCLQVAVKILSLNSIHCSQEVSPSCFSELTTRIIWGFNSKFCFNRGFIWIMIQIIFWPKTGGTFCFSQRDLESSFSFHDALCCHFLHYMHQWHRGYKTKATEIGLKKSLIVVKEQTGIGQHNSYSRCKEILSMCIDLPQIISFTALFTGPIINCNEKIWDAGLIRMYTLDYNSGFMRVRKIKIQQTEKNNCCFELINW